MKTTITIVVEDNEEEGKKQEAAAKEKPPDDLTQVLAKIGEVVQEVKLLRGRVGIK